MMWDCGFGAVRTAAGRRARRSWARRGLEAAVALAVMASVGGPLTGWAAGGVGGGGGTVGGMVGGNLSLNNVAAGAAALSQAGGVTTIRTGSRTTILNFDRLSVGAGETLQFVQPSANSRVLNRILGAEPTRIDGTVLSNGRVYFVNPAGVMFGNGAVINVGGLYAAAGHMSDADFVAGNNLFTNNTGVVRNDGTIQARRVHLVGQTVENAGQILAGGAGGGGLVTLTAGKDVYIGQATSPTGQTSVLVKVSGETGAVKAGTGVSNTGTVDAGAGQLHMGAGDLYAAGIYNNGALRGRAITLDGGKNSTTTAGNIDAGNAAGKGGTVKLLGDKVAVTGGVVDASGATGGGVIQVGGDYHGGGATPTAQKTFVGQGAVLKADATAGGDGGNIVVWADGATWFAGDIFARGAGGGDGGFVEVSGKESLVFTGNANTLAMGGGSAGVLLLDPRDLDIGHSNSANGADDGQLTGDASIFFTDGFPPATNDYTITDFKINSLTANVVLQATRNVTFGGLVNINLTTLNQSLTVRAGGNVVLSNNGGSGTKITTNHGAVTLSAGDQGAAGGSDGNLSISSNSTITTNGGDVTLRATDMTLAGAISAGAGTVAFETNQGAHTIHLGTTGGDLSLTTAEIATVVSAGKIRVGDNAAQTGDITVDTLSAQGTTAAFEVNAGTGSVILTDGATPALAAGGNVTVNAAAITATNNTNAHAEITTNTGTQIALNTTGAAGSTAKRIQLGSYNGTTEGGFGGTVSVTAGGAVALGGLGDLNFAVLNAGANAVDVTAASNINASGAFGTGTVTGGTITLNAGGGIGTSLPLVLDAGTSLTLTTAGAGSAGNIQFSTGLATLPATSVTTAGGSVQAVTISAAGALQVGGDVTATGDALVIHAGTGGTGNLSFAATPPAVSAAQVTLWAGAGNNVATTAAVDLTNVPTFTDGAGTPTAFTVRQDASISDAGVAAARFANGLPAAYTLQSDGGSVTLSTAANVAGTHLSLTGQTGVAVETALTGGNALAQLTAVGNTTLAGDVSTGSGDLAVTGSLTVKQNVALDGANLTVTGNTGSEANKVWTLTTTFTGTTAFQGGVGAAAGTELGGLTVTAAGGTVTVGNGSAAALKTKEDAGTNAAADGHILLNENLTLLGATTVTAGTTAAAGSLGAGVADVTFGGTVNSQANQHFALTVNTPGVTAFKGDVGAAANGQLGGLTTDGQGGAFEGTVLGNGGTFGVTVGSPITFNDAVTLLADTTLSAPGAAGTVTFNAAVNSEAGKVWTLAVDAGGATAFKGDVGGAVGGELGALTTDAAGTLSLGNGGSFSITVKKDTATNPGATGAVSLGEAASLLAATTVTSTGGGDVTLGQLASASHFGITVNTGGATWFKGGVSGAAGSELGSITTDAGGSTTFGAGGAISVLTTGGQTYNDAVTLGGDTLFRGTSLTFNGAPVSVDAGAFALTLVSNAMTFAGGADAVQGTGSLTLRPLQDSDAIVIGAAGVAANTLYLDAAALATFKDGFALVTVGSATGTHAVTIDTSGGTVVFNDPVTIQSPGGSITVQDAGAGVASLYTAGGGMTLKAGAITLDGSLMTGGGGITLQGAVALGTPAAVYLKSYSGSAADDVRSLVAGAGAAGDITVIGTVGDDVAGTSRLVLNANGASPGAIDLRGAVGGARAVNGFTAVGGPLTLHGDLRTTGDVGQAGAAAGLGDISIQTTSLLLAGDLASAITIDTDASGGVKDAAAFDATGVAVNRTGGAAVSLTVNTAGAGGKAGGDVTLSSVGNVSHLQNLTLTAGTGDVQIGDVTLDGAFASTGRAFSNTNLLTAVGVTVNHTGTVTVGDDVSSSGGAVALTGSTVTISAGAPVTGASVTLAGTNGATVDAAVTAAGGFTSTGSGAFTLSPTGSISTTNAGVTITHASGFVALNGSIAAGTGAVSATGSGVTVGATGGVGGGAITLAGGGGNVTVNAGITGTGLFTSTGVSFTNAAAVQAHGISLTHTGTVTASAALDSTGFAVAISGTGVAVNSGAPVHGTTVTLTDTLGVTLADAVTATAGFTSTGPSTFTLSATGGIATTDAPVTITHASGLVSLAGPIAAGTGAVGITGLGVTTTGGGTIGGGAVTLAAGAGDVTLGGVVTGTGLFTSTGANFGTTAAVHAHGASLTHAGTVTLNGAVDSPGFDVGVSGTGVTVGAAVTGAAVSFTDTLGITRAAAVTAGNGFTSTGTGGSAFTLTAAGGITTTNDPVTITHAGGPVTLNGPIAAGSGAVSVTGAGITAGAGGTIGGGAITLAAGAGDVTLGAAVTGVGAFASSGAAFQNAAPIQAHGITVNHTGAVAINAGLSSAGFDVSLGGTSITVAAAAAVTGDAVTLTDSLGVTLNSLVTAAGGFSSVGSGASAFTLAGTGGITTAGGDVIITHAGGAVALNGPISAGAGAVQVTGAAITSSAAGTVAGGAITLAAGGAVSVGGVVTGTGLFTSTGTGFGSTAAIHAHGVSVTHTGVVSVGGALDSAGFNVGVSGTSLTVAAGAPVTGAVVTFTDTLGATVGDAVTASGGFVSTGTGGSAFTLAGPGGISTTNAAVTITHAGGLVTLNGPLAAGGGAVSVTGLGVTTAAAVSGGAVTLDAGTGAVLLGGNVTATGAFSSAGGAFTNNGVIQAHGITVNHLGAVAVNNDLLSPGFAVSLTGTLVTVAAGAPVSGSTVTIHDTLGLSLGDAVTATAGFTSTGAGAFTLAAGAGITTTNADVTITRAGGAAALNGPISAGTGDVTITAAGITSAAAGAITGGDVSLAAGGGAVTLDGPVTAARAFTAAGAAFTSTAAVSADGATVTAAGPVSLGGTFSGGAGAVAISGTTFTNAAAVSGGSIRLTQSGLVTLGGSLTAGGGSGPVTITGAGVTQTGGTVGGSLLLKGTGTFNLPLANAVTTLAADVTGPLTLANAGALAVGTLGTPATAGVTTHGGAVTLTLAGGTLTVTGDLNTGSGGGAGAIALTAPAITAAGDLTGGTVSLTAAGAAAASGAISGSGPVTVTGGTVSTTGGVSGASVTLTSAGGLTTGGLAAAAGSITLTHAGAAAVAGTFTAAGNFSAGGLALGGPTTITAGGTTGITVGAVTGGASLTLTSTNAAGRIVVGPVGAAGSRLGNFTVRSANVTQLGGDIFANVVAFQDAVVGGVRADVPQAATVAADGSLLIDAAGGFEMEQNQKLSVHDSVGHVGDLTIKTNHQEITVGDLSALGKIVLDTGDVNTHITLLNRNPQRELQPSGLLSPEQDKGMDIVAGFNGPGAIQMRGTVVVIGGDANHRVQFSAVSASDDIQSKAGVLNYLGTSNLAVIPVNIPDSSLISEAKLLSDTTVLDLVAVGVSGTSPSSIQGTVIPRDVQTLSPERGQAISGALRDALRELGIYARDLRTDEVIEYLIGRALYDDVPYKLDPLPTDNKVAANRLPYSPVLPTVDAYRKLFFKPAVDEKGEPAMENGKPKLAPQDNAILTAFGQTWLQYTREKEDAATPAGFRGYLEGRPADDARAAAALENLNQLRDLLAMIKTLGLTDTEYEVSRKVLLAKVRPANIREEDFSDVVTGPSTRAARAAAAR
jgi:filamentous hemagglutinin family protein